jgi:transposase
LITAKSTRTVSKFIQGQNRTQASLFPLSLDDSIDPENEVRTIDLFVDSLKLADYGFRVNFPENGRPAYHPADLLKLYIYDYLNKVRSSRDLEKEGKRNIEVMWLINSLSPDHNAIPNFRRDNGKAIKKVFRQTVRIAKHFELIGGGLLAGAAQNSVPKTARRTTSTKRRSTVTLNTSRTSWQGTMRLWQRAMGTTKDK